MKLKIFKMKKICEWKVEDKMAKKTLLHCNRCSYLKDAWSAVWEHMYVQTDT